MEFDPKNMKSIMEAIENIPLSEAPLGQKIKNGITRAKAAVGFNKAKGQVDNIDLANKMETAWKQWLGRTGKEGNMDDIVQFLSSNLVGFSPNDVKEIVSNFSGPIIKNNSGLDSDNEKEKIEPNLDTKPEQKTENVPQNQDQDPEESSQEDSSREPETEDKSEKNDVDHIIDSNLNILNTYMNRKYLSNMTNEIASKMENAIKNIVKNLPDASPETIKAGANGAWDAVAALENAGVINYALSGSIQKYLGKILSTGKAEGNPYVYIQPDGKNGNDEPLSAPAPHIPRAKPINRQSDQKSDKNNDETENTEKPRVRVKANSNPITEEALSNEQSYNIFKAAANYAYKNDLMNSRGGSDYNDYTTPTGSKESRPSSDSPIQTDKQLTKYIDKVLQQCATNGISGYDFSDVRSMSRQQQFESIKGEDDLRALAVIGYAFLRSI